ncbi:MAG: tetratricopeptide repeat protein, partial [Arenimonas sp.]
LPNNALVLGSMGFVERRLGRLDDALAHLGQAARLDPGSPNPANAMGEILTGQRRFSEAQAAYSRALAIAPDNEDVVAGMVANLQAQGDLDAAERLLAARPGSMQDLQTQGPRLDQDFYRRRFDVVLAQLHSMAAKDQRPGWEFRQLYYAVRVAEALQSKGDAAAANVAFQHGAKLIAPARAAGTDEVNVAQVEAMVQAGIGNRDAALREIDRAILLARGDAKETPPLQVRKALIHLHFGERDAAIAMLGPLLEVPYGLTPALLRIDPRWDALREDPRFRKLAGG